jgi:hypothetical protein
MDIEEEKETETIIVEPIEDPVRKPERQPEAPEPVELPEPVEVPARAHGGTRWARP